MLTQVALVLILVVGIAWLFRTLVKKASEKIAAQYERLSEDFGLELTVPPPQMGGLIRPEPSLHGRYRGREVSVSAPGKGLQNTRQSETVLKVELRDEGLSAQLAGAGMLTGLRQRDSGGKLRWRSGDEAFDAAVDIRSDTGGRLGALLDERRRKWLRERLRGSRRSIYIGSGVMAYAELGLIADDATRERFAETLEFFCDLAEAVEG